MLEVVDEVVEVDDDMNELADAPWGTNWSCIGVQVKAGGPRNSTNTFAGLSDVWQKISAPLCKILLLSRVNVPDGGAKIDLDNGA